MNRAERRRLLRNSEFIISKGKEDLKPYLDQDQYDQLIDKPGHAWYLTTKNNELLVVQNSFIFRKTGVLINRDFPAGSVCDICNNTISSGAGCLHFEEAPADDWALCPQCVSRLHKAVDKRAEWAKMYEESMKRLAERI